MVVFESRNSNVVFESRNSMVMLEQTCTISLIHDFSMHAIFVDQSHGNIISITCFGFYI